MTVLTGFLRTYTRQSRELLISTSVEGPLNNLSLSVYRRLSLQELLPTLTGLSTLAMGLLFSNLVKHEVMQVLTEQTPLLCS